MTRLTPGDMPSNQQVTVIHGDSDGLADDPQTQSHFDDVVEEMTAKLQKLREPFPPDMIEKLPKPLWKGAWDGESKGHCDDCHGYHPLANTIHLDYVGHANATNRLLEVDPFWEWQPLAFTPEGLPLFTKNGGLWIKLTVCGVTRLGYGDGGSVKEIIGDAIRNAAMRFGVALDLWAKIDLHAERNPGDGQTSSRSDNRQAQDRQGGSRQQESQRDDRRVREGNGRRGKADQASDTPPRAPNQDALDELLGVCGRHGLDTRWVEDRYNREYAPPVLVDAHPDDIRNYAAILIAEATHEPEGMDTEGLSEGGDNPATAAAEAEPGADHQPSSQEPSGGVGEVASASSEAAVDEAQQEPYF